MNVPIYIMGREDRLGPLESHTESEDRAGPPYPGKIMSPSDIRNENL